jgi:cell division protein ZapE
MDSFYSCVPVVRKTRLHFHEFMREVHRELEELRAGRPAGRTGQAHRAPLPADLLRRVPRRDMADAMILHRLLQRCSTTACSS